MTRFRFPALDGLRALGVLLVIGYTLRGTLANVLAPAQLRHPFDGGFVGVDVLVVLAGFLICQRLLEPDGVGLRLSGWLFRRFVPLHLAAWAIALCWVVPIALRAGDTAQGSAWNWICSALLLSGFISAGPAGYSLAWALSVMLWTSAALIVLTVLAGVGDVLVDRIGPLGRAGQFGRPSRIGPGPMVRPALLVAVLAAALGVLLLLSGVQLGDPAIISGTYQSGAPAAGRALLGLSTGMLTFLLLRLSTGSLQPPSGTSLRHWRFPPGIGAGLALVGLVLCVYRFDLVTRLHLIPVFPVAAALVYFAAQDDDGPAHRVLAGAPARWLGARAIALFVLHPAVLICVRQLSTQFSADLDSPLVSSFVLVEFGLGALVAGQLGHRYLDRLLTDRPARTSNSGLQNIAPRIQRGLPADAMPRPKQSVKQAAREAARQAALELAAEAGTSTGKRSGKQTGRQSGRPAAATQTAARTAGKTAAKAAATGKPKPKPIDEAVVSPELRLRPTRAQKAAAAVAVPTRSTAARTGTAAKKASAAAKAVPPKKTGPTRKKSAPAVRKQAPTPDKSTAGPDNGNRNRNAATDQSIDVRKPTVDLRKTTLDLTPDSPDTPTPAGPPPPARGSSPRPAKPASGNDDETS